MPQAYHPRQVTAVASGTGGNIPVDAHDGFVSLVSTNANNYFKLPANSLTPVGWRTSAWLGATAGELRLSTSDTAGTINGVTAAASTEAALPATNLFRITKVASATWILESVDEGGDDIAGIVPD